MQEMYILPLKKPGLRYLSRLSKRSDICFFKKEEIISNEVRIGGSLASDSTLSHILKIFWQHGFCDCFCIEKRSLKASVMPEDLNI